MLTEEQRFKVRYYLGFPDLSSLPDSNTSNEDSTSLLMRSSELEVRMNNLSQYAEVKVLEILGKLDSAILDMDSATTRFPFKRIEDITFREDELSVRWEANAGLINGLANILGISSLRSINPSMIGVEVI